MKGFVEGQDRGQSTLFPECLEDWIDEDNPVRVIDVFVDGLDLADLGFVGVDPEATGRPSYHPSVLLKLYIYGYLVCSRAADLSVRRDATLRSCGCSAGSFPTTRRLRISARITELRSARFVRSSSPFAEIWACSRKRALRSTAASSRLSI